MKPIDWFLILIGSWYLFVFLCGLVTVNTAGMELIPKYRDKVIMALGRRFFVTVVCFGLFAWHRWG